MRILLTGGFGQLHQELLERLPKLGDVTVPGAGELDLTNLQSIRGTLDKTMPDLIVNPAAYTAVDRAETERDLAFAVNAEGPRQLGIWAAAHGVPLIHYSTDYVFDGSGSRPWQEDDLTAPINAYGESKMAGEKALREVNSPHIVLRTSWLYSPVGKNFLLTMLDLGREKEELRVVTDQIGSPTSAEVVAEGTMQILGRIQGSPLEFFRKYGGTYHLACSGETSWHGFATAIFGGARARNWPLRVGRVVPISSGEFPQPARRPRNSRLSLARFIRAFEWTPPDWRAALERTLDRIV